MGLGCIEPVTGHVGLFGSIPAVEAAAGMRRHKTALSTVDRLTLCLAIRPA